MQSLDCSLLRQHWCVHVREIRETSPNRETIKRLPLTRLTTSQEKRADLPNKPHGSPKQLCQHPNL